MLQPRDSQFRFNVKYNRDCGHKTPGFHTQHLLCSSTFAEPSFNKITIYTAKKLPQSLLLVIKAFYSNCVTVSDTVLQFRGLTEKKKWQDGCSIE